MTELAMGRNEIRDSGSELMFELFIDGAIVHAPNVVAIRALREQGKIDEETPIRKSGTEKWSRVKNLKVSSPATELKGKDEGPSSAKTVPSRRSPPSVPISPASPPDQKFQPLQNPPSVGSFWAKYHLFVSIGGVILLAATLLVAGKMIGRTPEVERMGFVGAWSFDLSDPNTPEPKTESEKLVFAYSQRMLANGTMELRRDGSFVQTIPMFNADGSDSHQLAGTWELNGSGADLKLKLNFGGIGGKWIPIRRDSEDQFTQIFPTYTFAYKRKK